MEGGLMPFLFVGERPSPKAAAIGATWQNGRLSAKNLREAIAAAGYDPAEQEYLNLWCGPEALPNDHLHAAEACRMIRLWLAQGFVVVGMGDLVCRELKRAGIPHLKLVHPAARGAIRKTERYRAHVREVLEVVL
jgi:hypothetical protein